MDVFCDEKIKLELESTGRAHKLRHKSSLYNMLGNAYIFEKNCHSNAVQMFKC